MTRLFCATIFCVATLAIARLSYSESTDPSSATALERARAAAAAAERAAAGAPATASAVQARLADARQTLLAEEAWVARQAAAEAEAASNAADKLLAAKAAAVKTERDKLAAATAAARQAAAEKTAAEAALTAATQQQREQAAKVLEQKSAAAQKADEAQAAAGQALEAATAEMKAAETSLAEQRARSAAALDTAATAHAAALGGLKPIGRRQWDYAKARHLLFRAGFGGTPQEVQKLVDMGVHRAVDLLVEYHNQPAAHIELEIYSWERPLAYEQRLHAEARNQLEGHDGKRNVDQHAAMVRWWVQRLFESPRPLEEKLVLFWHSHFASTYGTLGDAYLMYQQNQLLRRYADNFEALLHGIVQDGAMLRYLNNDENVAGNNNENLGRELLELFSLGEENCAAHRSDGYTEKDVRDANTRSLTGATLERYSGQYRYYALKHDGGPKTLLGKTGAWGPHEAVDIMLEHPATARYVVKKLWEYFVYPNPEPEVVERLASVFRDNGYRVRPLLKNIFLSEQFYGEKARGAHIKSPVELLVGTAKVVKFSSLSHQNARFLLAAMGQSLFDPPSVAGWPGDRDWINTNLLMARYTATAGFVKDGKPDFAAQLKGYKFSGAADVVDHFAERFLLVELSEEKRQELIEFLEPLPPVSEWEAEAKQVNAKLLALAVLLVSTPEYQVN